MRLELHSQNPGRQFANLVNGFRDLDSAPLAASARMYLGLYDPHRSAQIAGRFHRLLDGKISLFQDISSHVPVHRIIVDHPDHSFVAFLAQRHGNPIQDSLNPRQ